MNTDFENDIERFIKNKNHSQWRFVGAYADEFLSKIQKSCALFSVLNTHPIDSWHDAQPWNPSPFAPTKLYGSWGVSAAVISQTTNAIQLLEQPLLAAGRDLGELMLYGDAAGCDFVRSGIQNLFAQDAICSLDAAGNPPLDAQDVVSLLLRTLERSGRTLLGWTFLSTAPPDKFPGSIPCVYGMPYDTPVVSICLQHQSGTVLLLDPKKVHVNLLRSVSIRKVPFANTDACCAPAVKFSFEIELDMRYEKDFVCAKAVNVGSGRDTEALSAPLSDPVGNGI